MQRSEITCELYCMEPPLDYHSATGQACSEQRGVESDASHHHHWPTSVSIGTVCVQYTVAGIITKAIFITQCHKEGSLFLLFLHVSTVSLPHFISYPILITCHYNVGTYTYIQEIYTPHDVHLKELKH